MPASSEQEVLETGEETPVLDVDMVGATNDDDGEVQPSTGVDSTAADEERDETLVEALPPARVTFVE